MERFSEAYLRALAAAEGLSVVREEDDVDGVDFMVAARGLLGPAAGRVLRRSPRLAIQLKCSQRHQPVDGVLEHDLPVKNYDELRSRRYAIPRILVVVCVPPDWAQRLTWSVDALTLRRVAFWASLVGLPATTNRRTCRVELRSPLYPGELTRILHVVAQERRP
ncbi:DUF4365 domain-containing protein [Paraliomyxa miuraensis]|uniref:DUF4365 domain-containing protein n=1 Tax=Paraliomyxa miuraensis TaxID=376150 RepID=UPI0022538446|nr:DUF4365 domain-containing protein [Paraliomyxa miuraensis]MCX4245707.1 DUF4365 domain-containing protein [Paraliomyxa miuraensis]